MATCRMRIAASIGVRRYSAAICARVLPVKGWPAEVRRIDAALPRRRRLSAIAALIRGSVAESSKRAIIRA